MKFSTRTLALFLVLVLTLATLLVGGLSRVTVSPAPLVHPQSPSGTLAKGDAPASASLAPASQLTSVSPVVGRPHAPVLSAAGVSPAAVSLTWTATNDLFFANYTILVSTVGPSGPWSAVGVVATQSSTSFSTASLSPGAAYWWVVLEFNSFGSSSGSNVIQVNQPTLAYLTFTKPTSASADFNWTNNASYGGALGFVTYSLYEEKNASAPLLVATVVNPTTRTFTEGGLAGGAGYTFYLNTTECYSACGQGGEQLTTTQSNPVTFGTTFALGASLSATRNVVDTGESDLFTCNPSGGVAPYNYTWTFGSSTPAAGPGSESRAYSSPGPAGVSCEVTDSTSAHATAATTVSVNAAPSLTLTTNRTAADAGEGITFDCTPSLGTPPFVTGWSFGDGSPNGSSSASHSYTTAGRYVATCSAVDATDTQAAKSLSLTISPPLGISAGVSSAVVAPGTALHFTGQGRNGSGSYPTTSWSFGDGTVSAVANASHAYAVPGAFTSTFHVTDSNGIALSTTLTVQVRALTVVAAPLSSSTTTGHSMLFNATAAGGAGAPYNYSWTFGDGSVGYGANLHHAYASAGSYHPSVLVRDRLGATNSSALPAVSVTVPPPTPPLLSAFELLAIALLLGLLVALLAFARLRRTQSEELQSVAPWVPQTDPNRTVKGVKICRSCGTANLPIRSTCEACGADLPRWARRGP
ncbi:MAG: PKD domain-containing protein [Thermoplasmata archaeon]|nr:PKD domain-containing protein [Thermoplasmata archaeon]